MFWFVIALFFILMITLLQFYFRFNTLPLKASCTAVGVILALWASLKEPNFFSWLICGALVLCMIADVILELHFVSGMLVFLTGHLMLITALLLYTPTHWISLLLWFLFYVGVVFFFRKYIPKLGKRFLPFAVYPAILLGMLSLTLPLPFILNHAGSWIFTFGALLFCCSDLLLAHNILSENSNRRRNHLVMYLYETAIFSLAFSVFYF